MNDLERQPYRKQFLLTFGEVDWARILYFPNLFHLCHSTLEAWFEAHSGQHYEKLLSHRKLGFPTVHIAADFMKTMPYGITLDIAMHVTKIGRTSVGLTYLVRAVGEQEIRARVDHVVTCVSLGQFTPEPIPEDLRAAFGKFQVAVPS